ncbi:MAG: hypothetical protein QXY74_06740 [Candidatus Bathyarchaeia archaeon]
MDKYDYVSRFVNQSLGLQEGLPEKGIVPDLLCSEIIDAVTGKINSSDDPFVEKSIINFREEIKNYCLERFGFFVFKERWPNGSGFCVALSHDTDNVSRPLSHVIKIRGRFSLTDLILHFLKIRSLYDNFTYTSELEDKHSFRSTFFVMVSNYDLKKLKKKIKFMTERGWEFCLHSSNDSYISEQKLGEEIKTFSEVLSFKPDGIRQHYLSFDFEKTWNVQETNGVYFDSTVGNREKTGFRIGLCTPFHPPAKEWEQMKLIEIPLIIMDTTLWGYLKMEEESGLEKIKELITKVSSVNGLFTVLWHTESLRMKGGRIYPKLLEILRKMNCCVSTLGQIARWWDLRSVPLIVKESGFFVKDAPKGLVLNLSLMNKEVKNIRGGHLEKFQDNYRIFLTNKDLEVEIR